MEMNPNNWDRAKELFAAALELEPSARASFLAANCHELNLKQQVEKLLIDYQAAGSFLDEPAFQSDETAEIEDPMVDRRVGAYKLVRRLGQGGMATVFLAVRADDEYQKEVAIKLVLPGFNSQDVLSRFRKERQTLAGLEHPNIVRLLDGGSTSEGWPFLVMDYVKGLPIDNYCDQHKLSVDDRLRLFSRVCEAVQYAHEKLVIHRDLKPSNILVLPDGTPKLLDFGIAKVLNPEHSNQDWLATQTGRCMTPAYASPEQARGESVTAETDIYSLGVVLYELLTGHRPYRLTQHSPAEIERAICEQEPETPSTAVSRVENDTSRDGKPITKTPESVSLTREGQPDKLRRRLRGDLDKILLKAIQKEPQNRYASVADLSHDIKRHLQHLPVEARRPTFIYRASKFVRRNKTEVGAGLLVTLALSTAAVFAFNPFGLRDEFFGSAGKNYSPSKAASLRTTGWVFNAKASINPAVSCESLAKLRLPNTTITSTESIPAGSFAAPGTDVIPDLPAFCRVEGSIKPTTHSDIRFEVWMPSSGWNGKFRGVENNGLGGSINFEDMAPAIRRGFATASTDTGHRGSETDSAWALRQPERVVDFGYRAIHEMTEKSKQIIQAFYRLFPNWSYFEGCSNGGREALMEAERFPEDYQGILAGASPIWVSRILTAGLYNTSLDPASYIPPNKLHTIGAAVLAACDALDGVSDGILNDPRQCHFDPSVLRCRGVDSDSCLTPPQVAQLHRIYQGLQAPSGELLAPGYAPGGEEGEEGWKAWITGPVPTQSLNYIFGLGVLRDLAFDDPTWDFRTTKAEQAAHIADSRLGPILNTADPDLRRFRALGGKIILYHGWSDAEVPGIVSINYYHAVVAAMGLQNVNEFARLYMVPGMQHCYSGPGPNFFGQFDPSTLVANAEQPSIPMDPQHNISIALQRWVEQGVAPEAIVATKYVNESDPTKGIKMTRPLCPYPQVAVYKGSGDTNEAANFVCTQLNNQYRRTLTP